MPGTIREIQSLACHTALDGLSFISLRESERKGMLTNLKQPCGIRLLSTTHDSSLPYGSHSGLTVFVHCADVRIFDGCHKISTDRLVREQRFCCSAQLGFPTNNPRRARAPAPHTSFHTGSTKVTADSAAIRYCRIGRSRCPAAKQMGPARRSKGMNPLSRARQAHSSCC